jgi:hypothetical protein
MAKMDKTRQARQRQISLHITKGALLYLFTTTVAAAAITATIATTATTVIAAMLPLLPPPVSLLVMCLAWLQAKGQAKPGQNCWPDIGFGPAWQFSRPEPGPQAVAFTVTLSHNSDR